MLRPLLLVTAVLFQLVFTAAHNPLSGLPEYLFSGLKSKSAESLEATLAELGIGDHANDCSRIVNITDSNWKEYLGHGNKGEWLILFTANTEHCASCELIDLGFNDASHKLVVAQPHLNIGRVDCSEEIILSTMFIITKPPTLYHISPATRTVRRLPPEVARPLEIVTFYQKDQWKDVPTWDGPLNPLNDGLLPKLASYIGITLKGYSRATDSIPRWLGLIIIGAISSYLMNWLHGQGPANRTPATTNNVSR